MERTGVQYDTQDFKGLDSKPTTLGEPEPLSEEDEKQIRKLYEENLRLKFGKVQEKIKYLRAKQSKLGIISGVILLVCGLIGALLITLYLDKGSSALLYALIVPLMGVVSVIVCHWTLSSKISDEIQDLQYEKFTILSASDWEMYDE